ncbi:MAG: YdaS family helix-turn-helix protein [Pseudomonadota bacterium]
MTLFKKLIQHLGGQLAAAEKLGVSQPTVSAWENGAHGMSAITALKAAAITNNAFVADELCPDLKQVVKTG